MKQIEKTASATNFTAINLGKLNELGDYLLELAPETLIPQHYYKIFFLST